MEAHATDEWPIGITVPDKNDDCGLVSLHQAKTLKDRMSAAKALKRDFYLGEDFRYLIDPIENPFNSNYSSWPFRCWIIDENGKIAFKSLPPQNGVAEDLHTRDLEAWLRANVTQN